MITVTSPTTKKEFEQITEKPIEVVTNGYEENEAIYPILDKKFSLAHIGSLLSERNPTVLWEVLSSIASENSAFKDDLEITLAGTVSEDVIDSIHSYDLGDTLNNLGYLPHEEALQLQYNAQLLLLIEIDSTETRAIIPGKLFEYMIAHRPIVALGPMASDIEMILNETNSGIFFTYDKKNALKEHIEACYKSFKGNCLEIDSKGIEKYSRRALTKKMAALIEAI